MTSQTIFRQYIWLVNTIHRLGHINLQDLGRLWENSTVSEGQKLSRATFVRHKQAIQDIFGIEITCNPHDGYQYSIANPDEVKGNSIQNWILSTLSVNTILSESVGIHDRILLESIPSNGEFLQQLIDAMKSNVRVRVRYKKYGSDEITTKVVGPYCVKLFKRRWYAQVKNLSRGTLYVLAFDRIISLELTDHHFEIDQDYDAETYFDDCIGIFKNPEASLTRIVFRAYGREVFYQRDLPFHHSQKEILTTNDYSDFQLWLRPTNELYTPILSRGCNIQVLEPEWLVEEIKSQAQQIVARYE